METLSRLVSESLARHGFDRPLDYRRLQWSRWFRCESLRSLLQVPSKPGVFAVAEEITSLGTIVPDAGHSAPDAPSVEAESRLPEATRRMLAVSQFFECEDMAFTLDRMLTWQNPMRARLSSGRYFIRYVAIQDELQRRSICSALNHWIANSTEKTTGIGAHFATSLEFAETNVARTPSSAKSADQRRAAEIEISLSASPENCVGAEPLLRPATLSDAKASMSPTFPSGF
jgi:hypothetical protein